MGIWGFIWLLSDEVREEGRETSRPQPSGTPRTGRSVLSLSVCMTGFAGAGEAAVAGEGGEGGEGVGEEEGGGVRSVYFTLAEKSGVGGSSATLTALDFLALV